MSKIVGDTRIIVTPTHRKRIFGSPAASTASEILMEDAQGTVNAEDNYSILTEESP